MPNIKVVILCGGKGARLREETELLPKPMLHIGEKPILWHIMKIYAQHGFKDFVLCLGYKGEIIKDYFYHYEVFNSNFTIELGNSRPITIHSNHNESGWRITLADTGSMTLKGARIKRIEKYIAEDHFMLTYGDGVADINLDKLISFHKKHGRIGTVTGVRPPSRFGELVTRKSEVISLVEKPQVSEGLINGGFFVFHRKIFDYLTEDDYCDFEKGPLEYLTRDGELAVFKHQGDWMCMDTLRDKEHLNHLWKSGKAFWKTW